jgi:DNA invertase Pin-like site-specific DNA recombinase
MPRRAATSTSSTPGPVRVVGYVRVSTDEQRHGPRAQRDALEAWCAANGAELVAVEADHGVSGAASLDKRPGLLAALDAVEAHGAAVLLVAKRDRLARDVIVGATVERLAERAGARVVSADGAGEGEGPEAMFMRRIVDAFAEYERQIIAARTRAALRAKAARGERVGAVPVGSRVAADGVRLEVDPVEAEAVELIGRLRAAGVSIRQIAAELNARGLEARGKRWHPTTVARVLARVAA